MWFFDVPHHGTRQPPEWVDETRVDLVAGLRQRQLFAIEVRGVAEPGQKELPLKTPLVGKRSESIQVAERVVCVRTEDCGSQSLVDRVRLIGSSEGCADDVIEEVTGPDHRMAEAVCRDRELHGHEWLVLPVEK